MEKCVELIAFREREKKYLSLGFSYRVSFFIGENIRKKNDTERDTKHVRAVYV